MHTPSLVMNQNYTTNDRMLQYRQITQYFLWIPSLQQRRVAPRQEGTHAANYL